MGHAILHHAQQCPTRKLPPTAMSRSGKSRSSLKALKWQGGEYKNAFLFIFSFQLAAILSTNFVYYCDCSYESQPYSFFPTQREPKQISTYSGIWWLINHDFLLITMITFPNCPRFPDFQTSPNFFILKFRQFDQISAPFFSPKQRFATQLFLSSRKFSKKIRIWWKFTAHHFLSSWQSFSAATNLRLSIFMNQGQCSIVWPTFNQLSLMNAFFYVVYELNLCFYGFFLQGMEPAWFLSLYRQRTKFPESVKCSPTNLAPRPISSRE